MEIPDLREFDEERRQLLGPVMVPNRWDQHGDGFSLNEVEYSCHYYNKNHFGSCDINHYLDVECCRIIESYILPQSWTINGIELPAGTWMAVMEVDKTNTGDVVWEWLREGSVQGFSPMGPMFENAIKED